MCLPDAPTAPAHGGGWLPHGSRTPENGSSGNAQQTGARGPGCPSPRPRGHTGCLPPATGCRVSHPPPAAAPLSVLSVKVQDEGDAETSFLGGPAVKREGTFRQGPSLAQRPGTERRFVPIISLWTGRESPAAPASGHGATRITHPCTRPLGPCMGRAPRQGGASPARVARLR